MKTEKEKMLAGELYDALDKQLSDERIQTRLLIKELNDSSPVMAIPLSRISWQTLPAEAARWCPSAIYVAGTCSSKMRVIVETFA